MWKSLLPGGAVSVIGIVIGGFLAYSGRVRRQALMHMSAPGGTNEQENRFRLTVTVRDFNQEVAIHELRWKSAQGLLTQGWVESTHPACPYPEQDAVTQDLRQRAQLIASLFEQLKLNMGLRQIRDRHAACGNLGPGFSSADLQELLEAGKSGLGVNSLPVSCVDVEESSEDGEAGEASGSTGAAEARD